jgi:hypothetical protein
MDWLKPEEVMSMVRFGGDLKDLTNPHLRFLKEDQRRKVHETTVEL